MSSDPEVRLDGRCAREGCTNRLVKTPPKTMSRAFRAWFLPMLTADPFCTSQCARAHHGATVPEKREYLGKREYLVMHGTTAGYHAGCTCEDCRAAESAYQRGRREKRKAAV